MNWNRAREGRTRRRLHSGWLMRSTARTAARWSATFAASIRSWSTVI